MTDSHVTDNLSLPILNTLENNRISSNHNTRESNWEYDLFKQVQKHKHATPLLSVTKWAKEIPQNWLNDLIAGLTVAAILIPQSLAYTLMSSLPAYYGFYCAVIPIMIYAMFGTSRHLAVGPVAMICLLLGDILSSFSDTSDKEQAALVLSFLCGVICSISGLLRLGFMANILSKSSMSGFINGLAIKIVYEQLAFVLQIQYSSTNTIVRMYETFSEIESITVASLIEAIIIWIILTSLHVLKLKLKSNSRIFQLAPFTVIVTGTLINYFGGFIDQYGLKTVGTVPQGLAGPTYPDMVFLYNNYSVLIPGGLTVALLGYIESISISKEISIQRKYTLDYTGELKTFGVVNLVACFVSAYPVFGALSRTPINNLAGAKSQFSGFISATIVLIVIYTLIPVIEIIPICIIAATVIFTLIKNMDFQLPMLLWKEFKVDLALYMAPFIGMIFISAQTAAFFLIAASIITIFKLGTAQGYEFQHMESQNNAKDTPAFSGAEGSTLNNDIKVTLTKMPNPHKQTILNRSESLKELSLNGESVVAPDNREICFCMDVRCPKKSHVLVINMMKQLYFLNYDNLRSGLESIRNLCFDCFERENKRDVKNVSFIENEEIAAEKIPKNTNLTGPQIKYLIFNCDRLEYVDVTASKYISDYIMEFGLVDVKVRFAELNPALKRKFIVCGLSEEHLENSDHDVADIIKSVLLRR